MIIYYLPYSRQIKQKLKIRSIKKIEIISWSISLFYLEGAESHAVSCKVLSPYLWYQLHTVLIFLSQFFYCLCPSLYCLLDFFWLFLIPWNISILALSFLLYFLYVTLLLILRKNAQKRKLLKFFFFCIFKNSNFFTSMSCLVSYIINTRLISVFNKLFSSIVSILENRKRLIL